MMGRGKRSDLGIKGWMNRRKREEGGRSDQK